MTGLSELCIKKYFQCLQKAHVGGNHVNAAYVTKVLQCEEI